MSGSVRLPDAGGQTIGSARILREPTADELAAPMAFSVALRMRDFAGLQARVAAGEQIPFAEMEERYLPLRPDYDRLVAWLTGQGLTQTVPDRVHMNVLVSGPVAVIGRALDVQFAHVGADDGEYTSAVSEPSFPAALAAQVLCVDGLQPEFRPRHVKANVKPVPRDAIGDYLYVTPDNVASAYYDPLDGHGSRADHSHCRPVHGGDQRPDDILEDNRCPPGREQRDDDHRPGRHHKPGEQRRVRGLPGRGVGERDGPGRADPPVCRAGRRRLLHRRSWTTCRRIPGMTVISTSYGNTESSDGAYVQQFTQTAAVLAAAGISVVASSGDAGSNPDNSIAAGSYLAGAALGVSLSRQRSQRDRRRGDDDRLHRQLDRYGRGGLG